MIQREKPWRELLYYSRAAIAIRIASRNMHVTCFFKLINTYMLTKRMQRVVVDGTAFRWLPVKSGVPQRTVLGPLMLVYINDIMIMIMI